VDESHAWLEQAISDRSAAELLADGEDVGRWCHAIAKYQQAVEKAVKAIVAALREGRMSFNEIGYRHEVQPFVRILTHVPRAPRARGRPDIAGHLSRLLDQRTRDSIRELEALIPKQPPRGELHRRNTEYPFQDARSQWTYPAARDTFSREEVQRFRDLSHRIADGASRIIAALRRAPR
jgi:hypothetical protein